MAPEGGQLLIQEQSIADGIVTLKVIVSYHGNAQLPALLQLPEKALQGEQHLIPIIALHQTTEPASLGKAEPGGFAGKNELHYAVELAQRDCLVVTPDYPGFGEHQIDLEHIYRHFDSVTAYGLSNHICCVNLLQWLTGQTTLKVGAIGHSLGGSNSVFLANIDSRVSALVCSAGFDDFASYAKQRDGTLDGWALKDKYMPYIADKYQSDPEQMPFDFDTIIDAARQAKCFFNIPIQDDVFHYAGAMSLLRKLYGEEQLARLPIHTPDVAHNFPVEVRIAAYDFLTEHIPGVKVNTARLHEMASMPMALHQLR